MDFRGLVWKRVWKITFLVWNRNRIWRTGRHTPTKNFQEYPQGRIQGVISRGRFHSFLPKIECRHFKTCQSENLPSMPFICGQRGPKNSSFSQSLIRNFPWICPCLYTLFFLISIVRTLRFVSNFTIQGHQIHNSDETLQTSAWEHPTDADHLITMLVSLHYRFISTCNF